MTRRLVAGLLAAMAGSAIAIAGTRMAWYEIRQRGRSVSVPDLGETIIQKQPIEIAGSDVAAWTTPLAVLMLLGALLCFFVGPRIRTVALAIVIAGGPLLIVAWMALGSSYAVEQTPQDVGKAVSASIHARPGSLLTGAGAVLATLGASWAWPVARRAPRFGLPETDQG